MVVNERGRYICHLCEKTFKTANILKAHMVTHSSKKEFACNLCENAFRTKGSLIRHNRRHTDERPYICTKCGKSFRESGALTRHMKSITPCTEKIRLNMEKDHMITREGYSSGMNQSSTDGAVIHEDERFPCSQCGEIFQSANGLQIHLKANEGCKLYRCEVCNREFLKAHLLRKHQESHCDDRKFKCRECGKTYKTVAHVKGHMRVHSEERPYPCTKCGKRYKTKNAQEVHFRTHLADKPYNCQFCTTSFREKGSLIRHIRHHTGEKPFKCHKCGRGFAEHGTLNRHLRTKGGCMLTLNTNMADDSSTALDSTNSDTMDAPIIAEEPHTVLVEFSSVVADTQEYIIEDAGDLETSEATQLIQGTGTHGVDSHILEVVQQIVSTASPGQQIILQNVTLDEISKASMEHISADTITIATPESLTEQVAMTLASAIVEHPILAKDLPVEEKEVVVAEDIQVVEQDGEYLITSADGELEIQTVIV
uniref:Transcription factor E4F1 n=1 Tax=Leptobrachium leishanense TaxID=445787 RepID=A0A8C5QVH8_9ANUR